MHKRLHKPCVNDSSTWTGTKRDKWHNNKGVSMDSYFALPLSCVDFFFIYLKGCTGKLTAGDVPLNHLVISVAKKLLELVLI